LAYYSGFLSPSLASGAPPFTDFFASPVLVAQLIFCFSVLMVRVEPTPFWAVQRMRLLCPSPGPAMFFPHPSFRISSKGSPSSRQYISDPRNPPPLSLLVFLTPPPGPSECFLLFFHREPLELNLCSTPVFFVPFLGFASLTQAVFFSPLFRTGVILRLRAP